MAGTVKHRELIRTDDGVVRFKMNPIVRSLLEDVREGRKVDLNSIWSMGFKAEDLREFYQLIGYSVSGYGGIFHDDPALPEIDLEAGKVPR